jgi:hypothetical protein
VKTDPLFHICAPTPLIRTRCPFTLPPMKSVAFFRNSWKKSKDRKVAKEKEKSTVGKLTVSSVPCTPATVIFCPLDNGLPPSSLAHKTRSQSEEAIKAPPIPIKGNVALGGGSCSVCSLVDENTMASFPGPSLDCRCNSRAKSVNIPPNSPLDGLPNLNPSPQVSGMPARSTKGSQPVRPPRPPPLNFHPTTKKRPVNTDTSPRSGTNRTVTVTVDPHLRAIKSVDLIATSYRSPKDSPGRSGDQELLSRSSGAITSKFCSPDSSHSHPQRDVLCGTNTAASLLRPHQNNALPVVASPRAKQALLDLSDSPATQFLYRNGLHTSSTPHLLPRDEVIPSVPPLPSSSPNRQAYGDASAVSLSSFPAPPQTPLLIRRKIAKTLALRPASPSLNSPLPISTVSTSDYTPLATPTISRPHTSPLFSKSYSSLPRISSPRGLPPLLFDPPSTPLPTPPTSPGTEPPTPSKSLRSVKSVNQLHSRLLPPIPPPMHRATSSAPVTAPEERLCIKQPEHLTQPRSEMQRAFQPPVSGSNSVVFLKLIDP